MPTRPEWLSRRRAIAATLLLGVAAFVTWLMLPAHQQGTISAWGDRILGHDEIKTFGLDSPYADDYARLLHERYGVDVGRAAGCCVTQDLIEYVRAYNAAVATRLRAKFGKDILAECERDARAAWRDAN